VDAREEETEVRIEVPADRAAAEALDATDELAPLRERFVLPDGVIYLDGNSLGPLPRSAAERVRGMVDEEWGRDLITSWTRHGWIDLPSRVGDAIAPLIGAAAGEVVVTDSVSVNLFKLLTAALSLRPGRPVILTERENFPSDLYVAQGVATLLGDRAELHIVDRAELRDALDHRVAVLTLTHVDFRTGELHDLPSLTEAAHRHGALVLWDLSHSAGAVPVGLDEADADLAVGCGYKYLNGGPGAPGFVFVARRLQAEIPASLPGWMGHAEPFELDPAYRPALGIARMLCGTPPILSLAALERGVALVAEAGIERLRRKATALAELFVRRVEATCGEWEFGLASPEDPERRGAQVSLRHPDGYPIVQALIREGVVGDFRAPYLLRFGFSPTFVRYVDVWNAVERLRTVMAERRWDRPEFKVRARVT